MKFKSLFSGAGSWNICAAVVVTVLALSSGAQQSFRRSHLHAPPPEVPLDFPAYYVAAKIARSRHPHLQLYYPPAGHAARSSHDLRIDATTPYGGTEFGSGLPHGFVTFPFHAPPFAALVMVPLSNLPWKTAYFVWQLLAMLMMAASIYLALWIPRGSPPSIIVAAVAIAVGFLFMPFNQVLGLGNIDLLTLFLWTLGLFLLRRGHSTISAACFALGTAIKIIPVLVLPLFALRRQWHWLVSYSIAGSGLLALSIWGAGWQNHVLWVTQVAPAHACPIVGFINRSLPGFIIGLRDPQSVLSGRPAPEVWCAIAKVLELICYGAFLFWCWKRRRDSRNLVFEAAFLTLIVLLAAPTTWLQYYVLAVLPLTFLWMNSRETDAASDFDLILLAGGTLILGSPVPEFLAHAWGTAGAWLLYMGASIASTLALIWVGMRMYESCVTDLVQPAQSVVAEKV